MSPSCNVLGGEIVFEAFPANRGLIHRLQFWIHEATSLSHHPPALPLSPGGSWTTLCLEENPLRRFGTDTYGHRCRLAASVQFPQILDSDFSKTAAKRFRELASGDATSALKGDQEPTH